MSAPNSGGGGSYFLSPYGAGAFLRPHTAPAYDGSEQFSNYRDAPAVRWTSRNAFMFHHVITTLTEGGTAPATNPMYGHKIRDELTKQSLAHAPPAEDRWREVPARRTYAEILSAKIAAGRDRSIADGWTLFGEKQFIRAIPRFGAAEAADRSSAEARVGAFCAAMTDGSYLLAESLLDRIIRNDPGAFGLDIDLHSRLSDPALLEDAVGVVGRIARQRPDDPTAPALYAAYLWFLGRHEEALRAADQIHREHRTSRFSALAARMRGEEPASDAENPV